MVQERERLEELRARARYEELRARAGNQPQEREGFGSRAFRALADSPAVGALGPVGLAQGRGLQAFNLSDEMAGGLSALTGGTYEAGQQAELQRVQQSRSERPVTTAVEELAGSAPLAAVGARSFLGSVATGAGFGAVTGAGEGETTSERLMGAARGGGIGAVLGGVGERTGAVLGATLSPLARAVQRRLSGGGGNSTIAQRRAWAELRDAFKEEGMTGDQVRAALRQYEASGFDDATLLDAGSPGGPVQQVIEAVSTRGSGRPLQAMMQTRRETQPDRVAAILSRRISGSDNYTDTLTELIAARRERADPLYTAFRQSELQPVGALADRGFTEAPAFQRAAREAMEQAANERDAADLRLLRNAMQGSGDLATLAPNARLTPSVLDRIKRRLDAQISTARRGGDIDAVRQLRNLNRDYVDFLDERYPNYAPARNAYAGDMALQEALEAGRTALRGDAEQIENIVSRMGESEREMFRAGLVRAAQEQAERAADGTDIVRTVMGSRDKRRRLASAFDSPEDFAQFEQALRLEQDRLMNARFVAPSTGSPSARRLNAAEEVIGPLQHFLNGGFGNAIARLGSNAMRQGREQMRRATDQEIARIATTVINESTPEGRRLAANMIAEEYGADVARRVQQIVASGGALAAIPASTQAGQ